MNTISRTASLILLLVFLLIGSFADAQDTATRTNGEQNRKYKERTIDRIFFGGYLGMQFGTITYIDISPQATYRVSKNFFAGLGLTYLYMKDKRYMPEYTTNGYGGKVFGRYHVWRDLFVQLEYDPLYRTYKYTETGVPIDETGIWIHDILVGGGYRQWLGNRSFVTLAIYYNINESYYSPYRNPIINIGFGVGF